MKEVLINGKIFVLDEEVAKYINTLEYEVEEYRRTCINIMYKIQEGKEMLKRREGYGFM